MTRQSISERKSQSGVALVLLLVVLILAGAFAFYRSAGIGTRPAEKDAKLAATLGRAKEALIARAVTDANRPGSLPCPDLITNSGGLGNVPGDGKADMFTMTQCPSYVGWLPWVTLDLPELVDDTGTRLWYVLTPELRDDDSAQPINSDRTFTLRLDGSPDSVAALVIAARAPQGSQARPSNNPADYLDGENGNGDDRTYVSGPHGPAFNDMVLAITRQELMAAVEKRVANEVKSCLEQHAASTLNTEHTYPWPAPLSTSTFRGAAGSLFGQLPATQPGPGPDILLQKSTSALTTARTALAGASTASDQMVALTVVNEAAVYARALYDRTYAIATALAQAASSAATAFSTLDARVNTAAAFNGINLSELALLRSDAATARTSLTALRTALTDSGIDAFPPEILRQNQTLQQRINAATTSPTAANFTALRDHELALVDLYSRSYTPNPDIAAALANAASAATTAANAANAAAALPSDPARITAAVSAAQSALAAGNTLRNTIAASRVNVHVSEISVRTDNVSALLAALAANPGSATAAALAAGLADLQTAVGAVTTASSPVTSARSGAIAAIATALAAAQAASDSTLIQSSTAAAVAAASALATAIAGNGDNVTRESIAEATTRYVAAQAALESSTMNSLTRAARVPYARAVQDPAADIAYWAQVAAFNATSIATLARKAPAATAENTGSAYYAADQVVAGIAGSGGTQALLQAYLNAPGNTARQAAATAALNATSAQLDTLLASAGTLDAALDSGSAEAMPTVWFGSACAFLQPASGSTSWWTANNWANTTFYQISNRVRSLPVTLPCTGKLQVNGNGTHCVVALSAGRALSGQNRATRTTANFLEGINADTSRDGDARSPVAVFSNAPVSATFNDRLGF
jgi:hypothetical protein